MKKFLLGGVALLSLVASAVAADMPVKAPILKASAGYNWTGFYTATGLGGAWWNIKGEYAVPPPDAHSSKASRFDWASMIGAQYQFSNNIVLGIEGGYNKLYSKDYASSLSGTATCQNITATADRTCTTRVGDIWTVGGRVGYAWDRVMVFGTGGYANGRILSQTLITSTGALSDQTDARHGGWYAGGGFEYFLTKFWLSDVILGAEYQHIDLRSSRDVSTAGTAFDRNFQATVDIVRARLVFKYSPAGAVVAKY